ncbi:hypothetical protein [Alkaliphilus transvaalensis]|uniref:hypothetical protein n=1 Tax=Alkaliphilus transvaalensis TaxID=114628 RepID=UPI00047EE93B|nr:hypothetical protein [Alkaliphilus transvaalensis]
MKNKKKIIIIVSVFILVVLGMIIYILSYPPGIINSPSSEIIYDEGYFITKFASENIQLLKENKFILTEEELNGYLNFQLENSHLSLENGPFKANHIVVNLLDEGLVLNIHGRLYGLPVRIQTELTTIYNNEKVYFTMRNFKFSRINVPERFFTKLIGDSLGMDSSISDENQFYLPIEFHEMVHINSIDFKQEGIFIYYELDREKLLEELMRDFRGRMGL